MAGRVDPPRSRPPILGLVASAHEVVNGEDVEQPEHGAAVRWVEGFSYRPEKCNGGAVMDPRGTSLPTPDTDESQIDVVPFEVVGSDKVSTFAGPDAEVEAQARAMRDLLACESKRIASELWKGTLTKSINPATPNRYLADSSVTILEGDRLVGYMTALAALERAINDGSCGAQGMIHARTDTVSIWHSGGALRRVGNLILTIHDTIVVPDAGYDGSGPAAGTVGLDPSHAGVVPSSDSAWAYATSVVDLRRSAISPEQPILERVHASSTSAGTTNVLTTYVRRYAAATWGCLHVGVHVDHTVNLTITGS